MSKMDIKVNTEIKKILARRNIPIHDGVCFLVSLYYGLNPSFIPKELERKVLASGIVTKDYSTEQITWLVPLLEESVTGFEWVGAWMDLFKEVNPDRRGVKREVITRMKRFFVNNPSVRTEDVVDATKLYLKGVNEARFCKKSHKFIYEIDGTSMLTDFVEQLKKRKASEQVYKSDII